jgi:hypothetical protein
MATSEPLCRNLRGYDGVESGGSNINYTLGLQEIGFACCQHFRITISSLKIRKFQIVDRGIKSPRRARGGIMISRRGHGIANNVDMRWQVGMHITHEHGDRLLHAGCVLTADCRLLAGRQRQGGKGSSGARISLVMNGDCLNP